MVRGDIVLTTRGTIGNVGLYDDQIKQEHIRVNSGMMIFRPDPKVWNSRFLYYVLTSDFVKNQIYSLTTGSAVPQLPAKDLKKFLLPKVEKEYQDKIVAHISCVVDKITLNRQINQTLEQMAQTLFKSWFVDFDPVIDNALDAGNDIPDTLQERAEQRRLLRAKADFKPLPAATRALFPSEFEETELGWVPKGWEVGSLANITAVLSGYAFKSADFGNIGDSVIKIKNINSDHSVDIFDVQKIPSNIAGKADRFKLTDGDLLMAMTGATVGKFGVLISKNNEPYYLNQRVAKFEPLDDPRIGFTYCALNRDESENYIVNAAQGSAQPNISASGILSTPSIIPPPSIIKSFNDFSDDLFRKVIVNQKQTRANA